MKKKVKKPGFFRDIFSRKNGFDMPFFTLVMLLLIIGLIMLFSASYAYAYYNNKGNSLYYISRQFVFAVIGVTAMLMISRIDYRMLHKFALPVMGLSYVLLVIVLFMPKMKGVRRWIDLGFITFQPSEIAKFGVILIFAHLISLNYKQMKTFKYGVLPYIVILGSVAGLMVLEPHLSGTILVVAIGVTLMFVGGTSLKWFAGVGIAGVVGLIGVILSGKIGYAMSRLEYWIDPFSDMRGKGWQTIQSLFAIGSGGILGQGLGNSRQKFLYISEPQNDFVFAVVGEELGFVGSTIIVILFVLLVWRGFVIAMKSPDKFGSLLAVGLTIQVGLQAALNIAVVTNTIPNTGISLPFFSAGGTSLVMLLAQMGVVLSISRYASLEKT